MRDEPIFLEFMVPCEAVIVERDGGAGMSWLAMSVAASIVKERPGILPGFEDGPGFADQDDPLAQEFQWPSKVWGLGIRRLNRLALMSYSELYPHTVGFSLVFASRAAMERFHGGQSLRNGLNALECADALEIERENMMDWAHPAARGLMLLEWDGSEIGRVER